MSPQTQITYDRGQTPIVAQPKCSFCQREPYAGNYLEPVMGWQCGMVWRQDDARANLRSMALAVVGEREEHTEWVRGYFYALASIASVFELEEAGEYMKVARDGVIGSGAGGQRQVSDW